MQDVPQVTWPPHALGIGSEEDTIQSCLTIVRIIISINVVVIIIIILFFNPIFKSINKNVIKVQASRFFRKFECYFIYSILLVQRNIK